MLYFSIRASNLLIVGMSGLGAEIAKNLILAGPRAVTLMDENEISGNDSLSQFLISPTTTKANRAQASYDACHRLNPLVELSVKAEGLRNRDRTFYSKFTLVVLIDQDFDIIDQANSACREFGVAYVAILSHFYNRKTAIFRFIACGVFGWAGFGFFDFSNREFLMYVYNLNDYAFMKSISYSKKPTKQMGFDESSNAIDAGPSKAQVATVTLQDDEEKIKRVRAANRFVGQFKV